MRIAIIVLVCLCLLPYIMTLISGYYRKKQLGIIDNQNPRGQYTHLEGPGARAVAAQQNAWEALIIYSSALLAITITNTEVRMLAFIATIILVARVFHGFFYIANFDKLRTFSFLVAIISCFYLFFLVLLNLYAR